MLRSPQYQLDIKLINLPVSSLVPDVIGQEARLFTGPSVRRLRHIERFTFKLQG